MSIKKMIKEFFQKDLSPIQTGEEKEKNYSKALKELVNEYQELEEKKIIITKENKENPFHERVRKIVDGYDLVNFEIEKYGNEKVKNCYPQDVLSSGDALRYKPFFPCIRHLLYPYLANTLNRYPSTVGSSRARQDLVDYLVKEGFPNKDNEFCSAINIHNVAFASSTTQAFVMILKVIARKKDAIIVPAPSYGIFVEIAEKMGIHVEALDLKEEDHFFVSPIALRQKIKEVNMRLKEESKITEYTPKCVAFLNINPHNPIGNVMSKDQLSLLQEIGDICLEEAVFVIDDLIYRDLTYDREKLALPMATIPKYFNNTISLFGLSKSYGLAGFRAGFVVMPTPIFWGYATEMFDLMDSISVLQVEAVRGAYNGTKKRYKTYDKYFYHLIPKYLYRLHLVTALIEGIDKIEDKESKKKIIKKVHKYYPKEAKQILEGIEGVCIRQGTYPQSGFFVLVDFTKLKGKWYHNQFLSTEYDLLKAMYHFGKVKYLMGENIMWPYEDEFVARVNFAIDEKALIYNFYQINCLVRELKDEEDKENSI